MVTIQNMSNKKEQDRKFSKSTMNSSKKKLQEWKPLLNNKEDGTEKNIIAAESRQRLLTEWRRLISLIIFLRKLKLILNL